MTKVFVVGDLHFSEKNKLAESFIERVNDIMSVGKYDSCILLGDVFHTHEKIYESSLNMVIRLFHTITQYCHLYVLVGNHDFKDGNQYLTNRHSLAPFKDWPHITVIDKPTIVKLSKNATVTMCPFVPKGRFVESMGKLKWRNTDMVFAHQEFKGAKMGSIISCTGDEWTNKYPQVVSGHIHEKQNLKNGVYYPGVPFDQSFGFTGKRIVTEIVFTKGDFRIRSIETGLPRKRTVYKTIEEAEKYMPETDDYIRLVLSGKKEEYNEFIKTDHAKKLRKFAGVVITHKADRTDDIDELLKDRKLAKCNTYKETFKKLVDRENEDVQIVYKKILA